MALTYKQMTDAIREGIRHPPETTDLRKQYVPTDLVRVCTPIPIKDDLANPTRRASPTDLAKPCAPIPDLLTPEAKASLDRINTRHEQDRIWDLIVLAAKSSRCE